MPKFVCNIQFLPFRSKKSSYHIILHVFTLNSNSYFKIISSLDDAIKEIEQVDIIKDNLDTMIDGMVIKVNDCSVREDIGYTNKFPKWAMAFKFEAEEVSTMLEDVVWQVGRSGKITPTAVLEPVELAKFLQRLHF